MHRFFKHRLFRPHPFKPHPFKPHFFKPHFFKRRFFKPAGPATTDTLLDLQPGERATFLGIRAGRGFWGRLIAMGFTPGVEVEMLQNNRHGPLLVAVRGTFVALGRGEAARVVIERRAG